MPEEWEGLPADQITKRFIVRFVNTLIGNVYQAELLRRIDEAEEKRENYNDLMMQQTRHRRRENVFLKASTVRFYFLLSVFCLQKTF